MKLINANTLMKRLKKTIESTPETITSSLYELICKDIELEPEAIVRCKDCKYFDLDYFQNFQNIKDFPIPVAVAHEIYTKWSDGCKTIPSGWCFIGKRRTDGKTD